MTELSGRATVLVNPVAGAGTAGTSADAVVATLRDLGFRAEQVRTTSAQHATDLAASAGPTDLVLPLGGDGMISSVAQGCVTSGALLTPLPAGRGNDFVRGLGLRRDTLAVTRGLDDAVERLIDVGTINGRVFIGTATIGFDAITNATANSFKRTRSAAVYTAAGVRVAFGMKPVHFALRTDGPGGVRTDEFDGWNLNIGNSGRHGGGLIATAGSDLSDGLLEVAVTRGARFHQLAASALLERGGRHVRLPFVQQWQATEVDVKATDPSGAPLSVFADGDEVGETPVSIGIRPQALRLYF